MDEVAELTFDFAYQSGFRKKASVILRLFLRMPRPVLAFVQFPKTILYFKMTFIAKPISLILLCFLCTKCISQDHYFLKVHFMYGSKPSKKYKHEEPKYFGGILGGHVGIECDSNKVVNFLKTEKFHWFAHNNEKHSMYAIHSVDNFYRILSREPDDTKKRIVYVPITAEQKQRFDSITTAYLKQTPYDYAFFGMRCSAAAYDILGQLGIMPAYSYSKTYRKIFYPKKLRKRLSDMAVVNGWKIEDHPGTIRRKWEKD